MNQQDVNSGRDTLDALLRWRAQLQPEQIAYTFLVDGETEEINLTYAALDRKARAIAALLQQRGIEHHDARPRSTHSRFKRQDIPRDLELVLGTDRTPAAVDQFEVSRN